MSSGQLKPVSVNRGNARVRTCHLGTLPSAANPIVDRAVCVWGPMFEANGHERFAYLRDVLTRLPTHLDRDIPDLLPQSRNSTE